MWVLHCILQAFTGIKNEFEASPITILALHRVICSLLGGFAPFLSVLPLLLTHGVLKKQESQL